MAYLRDFTTICKNCGKRPVVELIDRWNGNRGTYCRKCGEKALKLQNLRENPPS